MNKTTLRPVVLLAASGLLFGCATTQPDMGQELAEVRAIAEQAAADAAAAKAAAAAAQQRADEAMATANSAKQQSDDTEAKIDRMFKKAMYK